MFEFAYPWLLVVTPLPIVVYFLLPAYKEQKSSIKVPFFKRLVELTGENPGKGAIVLERMHFQRIWLLVSWGLIVVALAKPQYVGEPIVIEKSGRDLMIAVDLSGSMDATDFVNSEGEKVDRLTAVKSVLAEFVEQREHDRLGLIVFGDAPFLQAPFTEDHKTWLTLLQETKIGMAGMSTALGDAIGLSLKSFSNSDTENRVLIVLTDGNDTGSKVPPIDAAKVAKQFDVTVYTIAIGDPVTQGEEALDVETLARVADITGGENYQALDREQLEKAYQQINSLEVTLFDSMSYRPKQSLHHYPLAIVMVIYLLFFLVMTVISYRAKQGAKRDERHDERHVEHRDVS